MGMFGNSEAKGSIAKAIEEMAGNLGTPKADERQDKTLALHRKHIQALWSHLERIEQVITVNRSGELRLEMGSASITMKKSGDIEISGKDITIKGSGRINVKASGDLVMKGSKILQN